jgi:PIN domain nuclease of toxin-antitoxin system
MTYIVDSHIFIWFLDKSKRLKQHHYQVLIDKNSNFVFSAIVLAEIKYLISQKRIKVNFETVLDFLSDLCG